MTEKPKIPYNSQMAFAIAAGRDADASRIMAEAMGEIVGKACGFAQLFDFSDLPFVVAGMKMVWLTDEILSEHYAHLKEKPFFQRIKDAMSVCPVIVCCWEGVDAIHVVRTLAGTTNGRNAAPGTIRGDYSMSVQENIVHASDSPETAEIELKRFFKDDEIFDYELKNLLSLYANDEF